MLWSRLYNRNLSALSRNSREYGKYFFTREGLLDEIPSDHEAIII